MQVGESTAILGLIKGKILYRLAATQAERGEALRVVERSANTLLVFDNKQKYAEGRITFAALLWEEQRNADAVEVLEATAEALADDADPVTLAYIVNNIGLNNVALCRFTEAERCFLTAMEIFDRHGLAPEVPRCRGGLVLIATARGDYDWAISELYKCRADYLRLDMPIVAAEVMLDIVSLLVVAERHDQVPTLCMEMVETFTAAGLQREAMKALAYLAESTQREPPSERLVSQNESVLQPTAGRPDSRI